MRVPERVHAAVADPRFVHSANDDLRDEVRLMVVAVRFAKDQIQVFVVGCVKPAVLLLLFLVEPQRDERGLRQLARSRLAVLRSLHPKACPGLFQRFADGQYS